MVWTRACFCCEFSSVCCDAETASLPSPSLFIAWRLLMHDWSPVSLSSGAGGGGSARPRSVWNIRSGWEKANPFAETVESRPSKHLRSTVQTSSQQSFTGANGLTCTYRLWFFGGFLLLAISYVLQSVHSRGCVDCMAVALWGAGRHSVGRRSILFNLGHLTHKAWRAHPWELWSLLHWRQSARPPPLRINYICLRCPGV